MGNMKNFTPWILGLILSILSGCLPQEKVTQCAEGQAFNPSQRRCVASVGDTGNIITIESYLPAQAALTLYKNSGTPVNYIVTVADPYNSGFKTKWELITPTNTTIPLAMNTLTYALTPNGGHMSTIGTYSLVFTITNVAGTVPIKTQVWTLNVVNETIPTIITKTPSVPVVNRYTNQTNNLSFQVDVKNEAERNLHTVWYLDGVIIATNFGNAIDITHTINLTPAQLALPKTYSLQALIKSATSTENFDSYTWNITVVHPATPTITNIEPQIGPTITAIDGVSLQNNGFYTTNNSTQTTINDFCVTVSNKNGSDGQGVDVKFFMGGVPFPASGLPANTAIINDATACISHIPADPVVNLVNQQVGEARVFSARVFDKGTGVELTSVLNPINWNLSIRPANENPIARIDRSNISSLTDEVTCYTDGTYTTLNAVSNQSTVNHCRVTQDIPTTFTFKAYDSDYPLTYASDSSPLPSATTNLNRFRVDYYLNGQLLDGSHPLSSSNCSFDYSDGNSIAPGSSKFSCPVTFRSYGPNGHISVNGLTYTLTAKVTDYRRWPTPGTPGVESNIQTWQVTRVIESLAGVPEISPQVSTSTGSPLLDTESGLFRSTDLASILPSSGAAVISENEILSFNLAVSDLERHNGTFTITRCAADPTVTGVCSPAETSVSSTVTRSNSNYTVRKIIPYPLKDNVIVGADEGMAYFQVNFAETNDAGSPVSHSVFMQVPVKNYNPAPVFAPIADVQPDPAAATPYITFTGFPFTVDPGSITDANQLDGNVIEYQWRLSNDSGLTWHNIEGATNRILVWTPPKDMGFDPANPLQAVNVRLKLCVGDNGFGNDISVAGEEKCTDTETTPYSWNLDVYNSAVSLASHDLTSNLLGSGVGSEKAVWIDENSSTPVTYTAYATSNSSGASGYIIVEKTILNQDSAPAGSIFNVTAASQARSIIFQAFPAHSDCRPYDLSITGHNSGNKTDIYLSYVCKDLSNVDKLHVRHIKALEGKTGLAHPGTFGFDYNGLSTGTELTVSASMTLSTVDHKKVIGITSVTNGHTLQFNLTSTPLTITVGTDICASGCGSSASQMAIQLRDYINASTDLNLQGFVATANGNQVTLDGVTENDYYILDSAHVSGAGKIQMFERSGNYYWYVPYLDSSASAPANKNKVSVLMGRLGDLNYNMVANTGVTLLGDTTQTLEIDNQTSADGQSVVIATRTYDNRVNVYHYNISQVPPSTVAMTLAQSTTNLFASKAVRDIRLALNFPGNPHSISVAGRYASDASIPAAERGKVAIYYIGEEAGTYDLGLVNPGSVEVMDTPSGVSLTSTTASGTNIDLNKLADFRIAAGPNEKELIFLFSTDRTNATQNELFIGKIYFDGSNNPIIQCSGEANLVCAPLLRFYSHTGSEGDGVRDTIVYDGVTITDKVAISNVAEVTLGTAGATADENKRFVIGTAYSSDTVNDGSVDNEAQIEVQQNILNINDESINTLGPDYSGVGNIRVVP